MENVKKLIIVDDHEFFRKGVMLTLERFPFIKIVGEASNGHEFLDLLKRKSADIVLMDINMPGMDGVETTKKALHVNPNLKIIALTMFGEEHYMDNMIDAGASGFILKNIDTAGLEYALKTVSEGKNYYSPEVMNFFANKRAKKNQTKLTKRETEIVEYVAKGLTNQQIADTLCVSLRTITNHRANMHKKVGVKNTIGLLSWAIKQNIIKKI